MQVLAAGGENS